MKSILLHISSRTSQLWVPTAHKVLTLKKNLPVFGPVLRIQIRRFFLPPESGMNFFWIPDPAHFLVRIFHFLHNPLLICSDICEDSNTSTCTWKP
jgi:hypothetical protein